MESLSANQAAVYIRHSFGKNPSASEDYSFGKNKDLVVNPGERLVLHVPNRMDLRCRNIVVFGRLTIKADEGACSTLKCNLVFISNNFDVKNVKIEPTITYNSATVEGLKGFFIRHMVPNLTTPT